MMSVEIKISCLLRNGEDFCIITILTVICLNLGIDVSLILIPYFREKNSLKSLDLCFYEIILFAHSAYSQCEWSF